MKKHLLQKSAAWTNLFKNIFAVTAVTLALLPLNSSANDFKLSADGKTLLKYQGNATEVVIPQGVTKIGMRSLWRNNNIERVVIPEKREPNDILSPALVK